jgi:hypothetical protein
MLPVCSIAGQSGYFLVGREWRHSRNKLTCSLLKTIGVGTMACKANDEMTKFLLSKDSLYCFSNSSLDFAPTSYPNLT